MKVLTIDECKSWLASHNIIHQPYNDKKATSKTYHYLQSAVCKNVHAGSALVPNLITELSSHAKILIEMTDWECYPEPMAFISVFRKGFGETRPLIAAPGHLFEDSEIDCAAGLFLRSFRYQWTSYLYLATPSLTVLNWEGTTFDFWSKDVAVMKSVANHCEACGLKGNAK